METIVAISLVKTADWGLKLRGGSVVFVGWRSCSEAQQASIIAPTRSG